MANGATAFISFEDRDTSNRAMVGFQTAGFECSMCDAPPPRRRRAPRVTNTLAPLALAYVGLPPRSALPLSPSAPPTSYEELKRRAAERQGAPPASSPQR